MVGETSRLLSELYILPDGWHVSKAESERDNAGNGESAPAALPVNVVPATLTANNVHNCALSGVQLL